MYSAKMSPLFDFLFCYCQYYLIAAQITVIYFKILSLRSLLRKYVETYETLSQ